MSRFALIIICLAVGLSACGKLRPPVFDDPPPPAPPVETAEPAEPTRERWQPRDVVADAKRVEEQMHTVEAGDTLSRIARRTGTTVRRIAEANGLAPPYSLEAGQRLRIPGGRYHTIKQGETGLAIALAYDARWEDVVRANGLEPPFLLRVNQRLLIPDGPVEVAKTAIPEPKEPSWFENVSIDDLIEGGLTAAPTRSAETALPAPSAFDGSFAWPLKGRVISRYGKKAGGLVNDGVNIAAPRGTPVHAAADGVVVYAGNGIEGFGNLVMVKHGDNWISAYAHADAFWVDRGDRVKRGDKIAEVGQTGSVDKPQLHFELRRGRRAVDPLAHLPSS